MASGFSSLEINRRILFGAADEGFGGKTVSGGGQSWRDEVHIVGQCEAQISRLWASVLERAASHRGIDALVLAERSALTTRQMTSWPRVFSTRSSMRPSERKDAVAGFHFAGQRTKGGVHARGIAEDFCSGDDELLAGAQVDGAAAQARGADFRALEVGENSDGLAKFGGGGMHHGNRLRMGSWVPWEKLRRATSMPASSRRRIMRGELVAGPRVQTILE